MNRIIGVINNDYWSSDQTANEEQRPSIQVEQLYNTYYQELKVFLRSRAGDQETVDVILQDIYSRLIDIEDLSVIQTPSAYLNRQVNNLLIDHQRRH